MENGLSAIHHCEINMPCRHRTVEHLKIEDNKDMEAMVYKDPCFAINVYILCRINHSILFEIFHFYSRIVLYFSYHTEHIYSRTYIHYLWDICIHHVIPCSKGIHSLLSHTQYIEYTSLILTCQLEKIVVNIGCCESTWRSHVVKRNSHGCF